MSVFLMSYQNPTGTDGGSSEAAGVATAAVNYFYILKTLVSTSGTVPPFYILKTSVSTAGLELNRITSAVSLSAAEILWPLNPDNYCSLLTASFNSYSHK